VRTKTTLWLSLVLCALAAVSARAQDSTTVQASASSDSAFGFQEFSDTEPASEPERVESAVSYAPYVHYNRVDQWAIGVQMGYAPSAGWYPRFRFRVAETFNRDHRGLYILSAAQPILSGRKLLVGAEARRFTDSEDNWRVGLLENTLAALLFKYDYEDWYETSGTSFFVEAHPWRSVDVQAKWASLDILSIPNTATGTDALLRNGAEWRANPAVAQGLEQSVRGDIVWDRRDNPETPRRGGWARASVWTTGPNLDSDFTFTRYDTELRGYLALSPGMQLKGRLWAGTTGAGTLTTREEFAVGGISSLRAHPYKTRRGDHLFLANAEYAVQVWRGRQRTGIKSNVWLIAFSDFGQAWDAPTYDLASQPILWDGGLGASISDNRVQLFAAHDMHDSKAGVVWTLRISSPF
jgi:surface antigen Omp85-like protein